MIKLLTLASVIGTMLTCSALQAKTLASPTQTTWQDYAFTGPDGQKVDAQISALTVPENRHTKDSRDITLKFVRFPSTSDNPKTPIVYLAGGPGGSATGTAKRQRFPLFMKLREVADVILFDQRGTGLSNDLQTCETEAMDLAQPTLEKEFLMTVKQQVATCTNQWQQQGIDLNGYNTRESAADLVALADALGTDKLNLWGISYGTTLAFATAKYYPQHINQMVLASSEGLDHAIKRPQRVQELLEKVDNMLKQDPQTAARYPDLLGTMKRVLDKLSKAPVVVDTMSRKKEPMRVGISKLDVQLLVSYIFLRDPQYLAKMPRMFTDMEQGQFQEVANYVAYIKGMLKDHQPMGLAMDAASGVSPQRWKTILKESETALVGRTTNLPHPDVNALLQIKDLGDEFRQEVKSDIPTLFFAGTLDGRTLYHSQLELAANFSRGTMITVDGAGHNLFMSHPDITNHIVDFFNNQPVKQQTVNLSPLVFE